MCLAPTALGMESGKIPDNAITASSTHSSGCKPANGRLNKVAGACAWTTTSGGKMNSWFQVDLGKFATVTGIATQGCCKANEWITSYRVSYSAHGKKWTTYKESGGKTKVSQCVYRVCQFVKVPSRKLSKLVLIQRYIRMQGIIQTLVEYHNLCMYACKYNHTIV